MANRDMQNIRHFIWDLDGTILDTYPASIGDLRSALQEFGHDCDPVEAMKLIFANIKAVLNAAGLDFCNVIKTTVFMTDLSQFGTLNGIYAEYFPSNPPARSCVEVSALPKGALVECEVIARR